MAIDPKTGKEKKMMVKKTASNKDYDIELTKKYADTKVKMEANVAKKPQGEVYDKDQGINIDKASMKATPKKFLRKVIKTGDSNGMTKIISDDGKTVKYEGRSNMKATKDALSANEKHSTDTNSRRESNANFWNISTGAKKDLDKDDKDRLVNIRNAVKK